MRPQDIYKAERCYGMDDDTFDLVFTSMKPENRFVSEGLLKYNFDNLLILNEGGSCRAVFYRLSDDKTT